jgi:hypothetical protein
MTRFRDAAAGLTRISSRMHAAKTGVQTEIELIFIFPKP